ncbi:SusD/RagB family nutrient-binding outer membrane lipoprotein [Flavobacterium turcicum]|uniref:SusD/RagB family nutrient-binding outer membrane lipoprotein n=1 Tax=Flavobacterium turcicum TaxID=2764718 RepID=A0ABR7JI36_9FLAO|nr:SusD/RagB family nutrient-binding outer membrane lipoprotein [Flavobacterium turcicum]MBC5864163.1 SusD/RagB family nutrient-binding outer membrane lipoprotein [Flavobacterium turcicum]NHL03069.1 SusD/RagB family nutrient-binding outer membrane lipoprotein [Flavobacterium turcicum]
MNIVKIIKSCTLLTLAAVMTASCSDYLDVDTNPNNPDNSNPGLTLPAAQNTLARLNATEMTYLGQYFAYNWATPSNWSSNQEFARYTVNSGFYATIFETSYGSIFRDLTYVQKYEGSNIDYSAYKAIATILKGYQYQYLVDLYGNVPYSEANQRLNLITPKYDDAQTVYKAVIDELTAAATLSLNLPANAENPLAKDIMNGGDMTKWAQFANTIKLRMLVRLSNTNQDAYIRAQIATIDANGAGYITSDIFTNPIYVDDTNKQSPFFGYFRRPITGLETDRGDFTVASDYTVGYLTTTNDPRLSRLYAGATTGGAFKGAPQSTTLPGTGFTSKDLAKVGPGLLVSAAQNQTIMSLPESLLLQAEAIARGYIAGGDAAAKAKYEQAVRASFTRLAVPNATTAATTYLAQDIPNVSWDSSPNKVQAIITQKWVALNGTSSIELWIEKTRTGFPANLPQPAEGGGKRPVRLLYPSSEISRNSQNVPAQTAASAFNDNPFWK